MAATRVEDREPDCVVSIQRLSQLVYGFLSGADADAAELVEWRHEAARPLFCDLFRARATAQWIPF